MIGQHENTFGKGMTSDVSILYQPDGTYRYMRNCQLITQDGNNFTIKDCMGNLKTFRINRPYDADYATEGTYPCPIGFISFPDELVVFSTNDTSEDGGYGEIGLLRYFPYGEGYQPVDANNGQLNVGYVPLYHHIDLNFSKLFQIEGFAFEENSNIKRVYWTDDHNQPRVFNIADPIFTTYIASGSIVSGTEYMVLEGAVTYDAVDYGPGLTAGNVFTGTATATYTNLTGTTPTPKIIEYYPVSLLDFTPQRILANIKFDEYGSGSVYCGSKIYFYRLRKETEGIVTSWSYGSSAIHVGTTDDSVTAEAYPEYFNFVGNQSEATLVNSGYSVKVLISEIDTAFDTIELACAEYDEALNTIRQITIVQSTAITGTEMSVEHTGAINLGELTVADVMLFPISILTCKTMTSNKNFALVGNITERMEFDFSSDTVTVSQTDYYLPSHPYGATFPALCQNIQTYVPAFADANNNPGAGDILLGTHWIVSSAGGAGSVTYDGNTYEPGEIFVGVAGVQSATFNGNGQARPCHAFTRYIPQNGSAERWNYVQIKQGGMPAAYWNYKHPATASHVKGYWNGDTYRFGILFYDKQGNPFYVRHLSDYTFDTQNDAGCSYIDDAGTEDWMGLLVHGAKFDDIRISRELAENISGFSIVRAERDKRILCQALMWQIGGLGIPYGGILPYGYFPCANYLQNSTEVNVNALNKYMLIVPDWTAGFPGVTPITANFSYLELASWVSANSAVENVSRDADNNFETQLFIENRPDSNGVVTKTISYVHDIDEGEVLVNAFDTSESYYNTLYMGGALTVNTSCTGGGTADLGDSESIGNKHIIIEIDDTFLYYSTANDYSDLAVAGKFKALVNITFDNAGAQYGGQSATSIANTTYIQCGHFQPITTEVIEDNNDTNDVDTYTELIFNGVVVYGGDAYTCVIDNGFGNYDDDQAVLGTPVTDDYFAYSIKFPCQTNVNYELRHGRTIAKNRTISTADGVVYDLSNVTRLEEFYYNDSYSSEGTAFGYAGLPLNYPNTDTFRTRIRYAGPKTNGEIVNSFRNFLSGDYKDMDGGGGEINNLRTKNGQTVVWQNAIISTVPILERQLNTGITGAETSIGTGGVVDRFDPITSFYGNQHQWGLTSTEFGYAWFDMRRKAFMIMDFSSGIVEISQALGMKGFFDEAFVEAMDNTNYDNYLNAPNFNDESDQPVMGVGITGVYDPKFKMVYMTFKFKQDTSSNPYFEIISQDFTIGYYHPTRMFVGFYDCTPGIWWNHNQLVISSNNAKNLTKYYGPTMAPTDFTAGDIIGDGVSTYLTIGNPSVSTYATPPSGTNFAKLTDESELWVHNQPNSLTFTASPPPDYVYDKFFGYVVDNEHTFVVNPKTPNPFSVQHMEQEGNDVKFTDLVISAESQTATESNIPASSNFYKVIWDKICSSLPLSDTGRIVNSYLSVNWIKKNWSDDRRVLTKGTKILRRVVSFFSQKR
jgi:hypothetical protein